MTVKSSISLTDDQHGFAGTLVEAGQFPRVSAVLQQGVELPRQQRGADALTRAALADVLAQRRSGKFVVGSTLDARLARMHTKKRRAHGVHG